MVINKQYLMLSQMNAHFSFLIAAFVVLSELFTFCFDKQSFGLQKCSVACFDKWPLIMIDKRGRDDTRLFV